MANSKDPDQSDLGLCCLFQKQSDLGLCCLSRPFWQATSVQNFRTFTVAHECLLLIAKVANKDQNKVCVSTYKAFTAHKQKAWKLRKVKTKFGHLALLDSSTCRLGQASDSMTALT